MVMDTSSGSAPFFRLFTFERSLDVFGSLRWTVHLGLDVLLGTADCLVFLAGPLGLSLFFR